MINEDTPPQLPPEANTQSPQTDETIASALPHLQRAAWMPAARTETRAVTHGRRPTPKRTELLAAGITIRLQNDKSIRIEVERTAARPHVELRMTADGNEVRLHDHDGNLIETSRRSTADRTATIKAVRLLIAKSDIDQGDGPSAREFWRAKGRLHSMCNAIGRAVESTNQATALEALARELDQCDVTLRGYTHGPNTADKGLRLITATLDLRANTGWTRLGSRIIASRPTPITASITATTLPRRDDEDAHRIHIEYDATTLEIIAVAERQGDDKLRNRIRTELNQLMTHPAWPRT